MKKLITIFTSAVIAIFGLSLIPATTHADTNICNQSGVPEEVRQANGCSGGATSIDEVVVNIINGIVGILSLVSVIFIVVGGVNYMASAGDAGKIAKAKSTILYAVIGLVICVLAFAIVNFLVNIFNQS